MPEGRNITRVDLYLKQFNRWTVIEHTDVVPGSNKVKVLCRCSCPDKTERYVQARSLTTGGSKSCGCFLKDNPGRLKHGFSNKGDHISEYHAWVEAKQRCFNENNHAYKNYGGRGITM